MAEQSRTVRVTGLPSEVKEGTVEDKLCIHFQRRRNGGGEVLSVTTVKTSPDFALITFEDSRVAQSVVQQPQQILEVDDKSFNLTVKEHPGATAQDKVIISLSATVDCSQLSAGKRTLKGLLKSHPDIQMNYNSALGLCTLSGSYSTVQAALAQLLGQNQLPQTTTEKDLKSSTESRPTPPTPSPRTQKSQDQTRSQKDQKERPPVEKHTTSLQRDVTPGGYEWELQGATASPPDSEEDFSLMVDADTFQYLQKYCREEYHQILRKHGVAVVDYTHQGLTTLLFQVATGDAVNEQERLKKAKNEISQLYEQNQANICRDKLLKSIIPYRSSLKRAIDKLSSKFTKLLFSEDEQHIYFIGSREEVGEAKRFLLLYDEEDKTEVTSPRRFQDSWPSHETKAPAASVGVLHTNGIDKEEDDAKIDGSPKFKLAAQFKDSRVAPIGSKTSDFNVRGHTQSSSKKRQGPMLAYDDVLSEANKNAYVNAQNTGGDILFKSANTAVQNVGLADTRPKTSAVSPVQFDSLGAQSETKTGTSVKRASSFSGVMPKKDQENSPKSELDTGKGRGRSSSFSGGDQQLNAEITIDSIMWLHVKKAYKPRIEELTSGIQIREMNSDGERNVTILLTGTNGSKVQACKQGLAKLVDSVSVDFVCNSLTLHELGIADPADDALQACCDEILSRYKKISVEISHKHVFLLGPKIMCSQIRDLLLEVFSEAQVASRLQDFSRPSTSTGSESFKNSPNGKINGSAGQVSPRTDPVIKVKVRKPAGLEADSQNAQDSITYANGSVTTRNDKTQRNRQQTTAAPEGLMCEICEKKGATVKRFKCGEVYCSDCIKVTHLQCQTCGPREERKARGIQGQMTYAALPMSMPGFVKGPVVKITYCIPDGIQGDDDPSPGEFFTGGTFEAFLPDCERTRRLLPRLEKAFRTGHTFTVVKGKVQWDAIPHKTSLHGGKPSGYPDSTYLNRLDSILTALGIS
ncbi:hypothetical protein NL108_013427 [Boleophthalmus pectinirostris]|uniref:uncharacterized protein si:busm1-163l24.3 n=1 Tax=Boleophthalmus pectinirostris TaxID=150288 RepID=UPI00242F2D53|nr:uncharacterized protein si:busm1-163l24.3 [Boleophthalmus pectinirostris]KAJ0058352.1 hypothetical protein NL108_013427 [Boleophthalmus pectinirostris]